MTTEQIELRERVEGFPLDDPNSAFPFTERLACDNAWRLPVSEAPDPFEVMLVSPVSIPRG